MKKKFAFTLAEVLITLSIIGVVTAMTIPNLAYRYEQIKTVNKVKAFYSKMNNLLVHVIQNNAELKYLKWTDRDTNPQKSTEEFWAYFKPYLSVARDCGTTGKNCLADKYYQLNGLELGSNYNYNYNNNGRFYKIQLKDGGSMWLGTYLGHCTQTENGIKNACGFVYYDVNGTKSPNTLGRDVFHFLIKSNEIVPYPASDCVKTQAGWACTNYILINENMDYLK